MLKQVVEHDYQTFYSQQIQEREAFRYPPFYRLIIVYIKHKDLQKVEQVSAQLQANLQAVFTRRCSRVTQPAVSKMQNMYIRNIILKIESQASLPTAKSLLAEQIHYIKSTTIGKSATIYADVDPM